VEQDSWVRDRVVEAIRALDGTELGGRTIKVNEAKDRRDRRF